MESNYRLIFQLSFYLPLNLSQTFQRTCFFVSFERLLRCPPSSVGHYHKVTPSLFGRPPRIHLKINQRTLCYFERLLRCPPSSVGHYHKVTPSLFGRPPRIHLKINQRTPCYFERLLRCPPSSVGHYHKVTPSLFGRPPRIHLKINQRTFRFSHFPPHLGGSFLNWAAKIRTFLLPANFFATFFKIFSAPTES